MDDVFPSVGDLPNVPIDAPAFTSASLADFTFENGSLVGRFSEGVAPADRVDMHIDQEFCGSASVVETDGGRREFKWYVPTRFYDRREHFASARLPNGVDLGRLSLIFRDKYRPDVRSEIRLTPEGKLVGYAHNSRWTHKRIDLEIWLGARVIAKLRCDRPNPSFTPDDIPEERGFVFELPENCASWLGQPLRILAQVVQEVLNTDSNLLAAALRLDAVSCAEDITAVVACPDNMQGAAVDVFVGDEPVSFSQRRISGARVLTIACDPAGLPDGATVSVRTPAGADISGSPAVVSRLAFRGLHNSRFERWSGQAPRDWILGEGVKVRPTASGSEPAIALELASERDAASPILRQALDVGGMGSHIQLVVRAQAPGSAVIRARIRGADGSFVDVGAPVSGAWSDCTLRLPLPPPKARTGAMLEITVPECSFHRIDFARVEIVGPDAGDPMQSAAAASEPAATDPGPWNAVANGAFAHWSKGFEFPVAAGSRPLADGWFSVAPKASPAARVRLASMSEPTAGSGSPRSFYGLEISGVLEPSGVALEVVLDKSLLARSPASDLVLVSARAVGAPGQEGEGLSSIKRVSVVRRTSDGDSEPVATIAHSIGVGRAPQRHHLTIGKAIGNLIRTTAAAEANDDLLLRFELDPGPSDIVLADVSFGRAPESPVTAAAAPASPSCDYLAMEDPTIVGQLSRLKGLDSWSSPVPLSPSKAAAVAPARIWAWGRAVTAVDIVIPVHNALQDVEVCLDTLERRTGRPHRVILVNDRSNLATSEFLRGYAAGRPQVVLIENPKNLGYTRSANIGLRASDAEWIVLLNSDTVVSDNWLEGMLECATADPQTALVGPLSNAATWQSVPETKDARGGWMVNRLPPGMSVDELAALVRDSSLCRFPEVPLVNGFCTLMRRDVIAALGLLDEEAFPVGYGEENDLCIRVKKAGYGIRIADHVYVHHKKSASFGASRRLSLAASGRIACDAKHPDVPLQTLHELMADCAPLIELRENVKRALHQHLSQTP